MNTTTSIPARRLRLPQIAPRQCAEARVFDARGRAALARCEAMTHVADRPVDTEPGHDVPGMLAA